VARVTVVNDNPEFLELVADILSDARYVTTLVDGDEPDAIDRVRASKPDVLMIDLRMGNNELHGWEVAQQVRGDEALADLPILICSADSRALTKVGNHLDATNRVATLSKPFSIDDLCAALDELLSGDGPH
jgi:CheY-like chemotaxis protein